MTVRRGWAVTTIAVAAWLAIFRPWTIRPIADVPRGPFDAAAYVAKIWNARAVPALQSRAVPFGEFQTRRTVQASPVVLDGVVIRVNASARVGTAEIDVAPADGRPDALLAIGPIIRGTALRDALGFIQFTDFTNQIEFATVASALNDRALATAFGRGQPADLNDRVVHVLGVATRDPSAPDALPVVVPVQVSVGGGR